MRLMERRYAGRKRRAAALNRRKCYLVDGKEITFSAASPVAIPVALTLPAQATEDCK